MDCRGEICVNNDYNIAFPVCTFCTHQLKSKSVAPEATANG